MCVNLYKRRDRTQDRTENELKICRYVCVWVMLSFFFERIEIDENK